LPLPKVPREAILVSQAPEHPGIQVKEGLLGLKQA
jgi:hypothetical protein